jgi:ketosteroid isomerase-like protein
MAATEDFLAATMPRLIDTEIALHNGDAGPRSAMWSRTEPLTLFGAADVLARGWSEIVLVFQQITDAFSDCTAYENEVIAAEASGDLAYTVALEHSTVSINGTPRHYVLRVTTVFRREDGEWKVVHRHGDSQPAGPGTAVRDWFDRPPAGGLP